MYIFDSRSEFYRFPQGGIEAGKILTLKIHVKRSFSSLPEVLVEKRHNYTKETFMRKPMEWVASEKTFDLYKCLFSIDDPGNYFFSFILENAISTELHQLIVHEKNYSTPDWIRGGIIYHIFVDRFYRERILHKDDEIIIRSSWGDTPFYIPDEKGEIKNNDFFGGNLEGIIRKLPYIKSLGASAIYLSPIFEAHSNHKYDTGDYMSVDPMFGSEETLKELCVEAEKFGISVILDGVFSHTGSDSIYFNKENRYSSTGAFQSTDSPYFGWYTFRRWNDDYDCWWNIKILPALNKENNDYMEFITGENGILNHWQKCGIRGWRLDVADELPDSFLNKLRKSVKTADHETLIVGEVWEDASDKYAYGKLKQYFCGNQLDSATNYPLRNAIIDYLKNRDCRLLYETMGFIMEKYPPESVNCLMNILGTHDTARILTVLGSTKVPENKEEMAFMKLSLQEERKGIKLLKIAVLLQMTLPGVPCIYYGDEAGMQGWTDPFNRRCFPWGDENKDILNHYKLMGKLRESFEVFKDGKYRCLVHEKGFFAFERSIKDTKIIIAVNIADEETTLILKHEMKEYINSSISKSFTLKSCEYLVLHNDY
ncbi:MAG: glycoside hydrolase family 13 protein [Sedimentibacter sp.]|uniref:glycoside hydrolase family 13 protein n=1 Tax=Sedimentibacter sp. TaxID=1960295 RepID=UPI003157FDBD